jgi:hypothetical protein
VSCGAEEVTLPFYRNTFTQGRLDAGVRGSYKGLPALLSKTLGAANTAAV